MRKMNKFFLSALCALCFSGNVFSQCTPQVFRGEGTFYGYGGGGNCSFPFPYTNMPTAAVNQSQYSGSKLCGACAEVTGERGTVTLSLEDQCPECKFGDLDLSERVFPLVADPIKGRVPISWKIVPCPVSGPVSFYFKEGSSAFWTAVQVRNHRYPVTKFEVKQNGQYVTLNREPYNYFVAYSGMGQGPYSFRITDLNGNVIEETNVPLLVTTPISGRNQFPICGGGSNKNYTVRAKGTSGRERIEVVVGSTVIASYTLTTAMANYTVESPQVGTVHIRYVNDDPSSDVQIDYLKIDNTILESELQVINTGVYQNNRCGGTLSDMLHCNGYIEYQPNTNNNKTYTIRAKGVNGTESIRLLVNNVVVKVITLTTTMADYTATAGTGTVRVEFTNDNGAQRDVQVDYVKVGNTTLQSEVQTINTGVYQNNRCGGSNSEWLHCNGYIEYAGSATASKQVVYSAVPTKANTVETNKILIYPSIVAANSKFTIALVNAGSSIGIYDINGRLVKTINTNGNTLINVEANLKPSIYIVRVKGNNEEKAQTLIVQ